MLFQCQFIAGGQIQGTSSNLELFYEGETSKLTVRDMEIFKLKTPLINAGDRGGAFIKVKSDKLDPKRGAVIYDASKLSADDNLVRIGNRFEIELKAELASELPKLVPIFFGTNMIGNAKPVCVSGTKCILETPDPILFRKNDPVFLRTHTSSADLSLANFIDVVST